MKAMNFTLQYPPDTPMDLSENDVRICSSQYEEIMGCQAGTFSPKPWKERIVCVEKNILFPSGTDGILKHVMLHHSGPSIFLPFHRIPI